MTTIFLTGASGYLGGQVLREITRTLPTATVSVLVRDSKKAEILTKEFPDLRIALGDLDNEALLEKEASNASIVIHLATFSHLKSVQAIHQGLKARDPTVPSYWIQISGATALSVGELANPSFTPGDASETVFDDLSGVSAIRDVIRAHPARAVDNYMLDVAAEQSSIRTAVVFPPIIYGEGEGMINRRSMQIPGLTSVALDKGHGVQVGKGLSIWGNVHVRDVGRLFVALVQAASEHRDTDGLWGEDGLYLTGVGEMTFAEISTKIVAAAKDMGLIQNEKVIELDGPEADKLLTRASALYGSNARSHARRGKELLNWEGKEYGLDREILRVVSEEGKSRKSQAGQ